MGEGTFEGFGVAGQDFGDAVEAVEVEGIEEVDFGFVEKAVAQDAEVEEVSPADACTVVPGLAEFEGSSASEEEAENVFVFGEGTCSVNGCVVVDKVGVEAQIEGETDGLNALCAYGSLDHVSWGAVDEVWRLLEQGAGCVLVAGEAVGDELL